MPLPQNAYPNYQNFQEVSFPQEVTPPDVEPDVDVRCVKYNPAWAQVLMSACDQLTQLSAWIGTPEEKKLAVQRATNLKWQLQNFEDCDMGCCVPALTRINADGTIEMSNDGGTTWTPAVGSDDPRNPVVVLPPLAPTEGTDTKCRAANSIVSAFEAVEEQYYQAKLSSETEAEIAAILITFLVAVGVIATGGVLAILGAGLAVLMTTISAADFAAAFTEDVWNQFLCDIYCRMDTNGQLTDAQVREIQANMAAVSGIAGQWFNDILSSQTARSMNNLAGQGRAGTRDCFVCTDCACNLADWDIYLTYGANIVRGSDDTGDYIQVDSVFAPGEVGGYAAGITTNDPAKCCTFLDHVYISGAATGNLWVACGEAIPADGAAWPHSGDPNLPMSSIMYTYAGGNFTVRIYLGQ